MSFIVLPSTITNPKNIPVTLTADSTAPMYASLTYTFTITDLDSYVTYTVSATNGTVTRTGGTISYTPASAGTGDNSCEFKDKAARCLNNQTEQE